MPRQNDRRTLTASGSIVAGAIALTAIILLIASTAGWQLGLPTFLAGAGAWLLVSVTKREAPWPVLKKVSWTVLPLVAGLFVLVQGIESTGVLAGLIRSLCSHAQQAPRETAAVAGGLVAFASNAINNLPMGLIAGTVAQDAHSSAQITGALLIGVDLGPNLSVTGSLATATVVGCHSTRGRECECLEVPGGGKSRDADGLDRLPGHSSLELPSF